MPVIFTSHNFFLVPNFKGVLEARGLFSKSHQWVNNPSQGATMRVRSPLHSRASRSIYYTSKIHKPGRSLRHIALKTYSLTPLSREQRGNDEEERRSVTKKKLNNITHTWPVRDWSFDIWPSGDSCPPPLLFSTSVQFPLSATNFWRLDTQHIAMSVSRGKLLFPLTCLQNYPKRATKMAADPSELLSVGGL